MYIPLWTAIHKLFIVYNDAVSHTNLCAGQLDGTSMHGGSSKHLDAIFSAYIVIVFYKASILDGPIIFTEDIGKELSSQ